MYRRGVESSRFKKVSGITIIWSMDDGRAGTLPGTVHRLISLIDKIPSVQVSKQGPRTFP